MVMKRAFWIGIALAFSAVAAWAQAWQLKDVGVGLVTVDGDYAKVLKIAERRDEWDLKELYENGGLSNRYKGDQGFYAWLVGPPVEKYLNKNGLPVWNYKYKFTYPSGSTYESGTGGFYGPGFAAVGISVGSETAGRWKIEWFIVNRDTNEVRAVATKEFTATWGKPAVQASADWELKDAGVGLITVDAEYAKVLKIVERGDEWNLRKLYDGGALANRYKGDQGFYAWIAGPPLESYLDENGLPTWNYKYKFTYPDGSTYESGTGGFYGPGFAAVGISVGGGTSGKWKIEWYIVNRNTKEERRVAVKEFTTTW